MGGEWEKGAKRERGGVFPTEYLVLSPFSALGGTIKENLEKI